MKVKKFPEYIFVRRESDTDDTEYLVANDDAMDSIEDDGPTLVASYKLVGLNELSKRIVSKEISTKK